MKLGMEIGRDKPMPTPFTRPFPPEILTIIITNVDFYSIHTLLRVSKHFFDIAGKKVYERIDIDCDYDVQRVMMGTVTASPEGEARGEDGPDGHPTYANFKRQLLKHVKIITIRPHSCPTSPFAWLAVTEGAKMMTGLERVILSPNLDDTTTLPLCQYNTCPLLSGIECKSVTVGNLHLDHANPSGSHSLVAAIKQAQHVTLVLPPTLMFMNMFGALDEDGVQDDTITWPKDLVDLTRHCETVRVIVAITDMEVVSTYHDVPTSTFDDVYDFLSYYVTLEKTKSEIEFFIFYDFGYNLDLDEFRVEFEEVVTKRYEHHIKSLKESNEFKPEHIEWSPNYQIQGMKEYFDIPGLGDELDIFWIWNWEGELYQRRNMTAEEWEAARIEENAKYDADMRYSGSNHIEDPVDGEIVADVANSEELIEEDKVEEKGEDDGEGRGKKNDGV